MSVDKGATSMSRYSLLKDTPWLKVVVAWVDRCPGGLRNVDAHLVCRGGVEGKIATNVNGKQAFQTGVGAGSQEEE